jgi:uncharacterized membrane protein YphA (DoxX/SURF4 family)
MPRPINATSPSLWTTLVGLVFATAGIAKLLAIEPEARLFRSWGWTRHDMQTIGAAELAGAALLVTGPTQKLGAALLSSSSICILITELRHHDDALVTPRMALLAAAISGFIAR